tara:strand:- start:283 stop:777 length:495 start_codon:yes stop_codon:yes gene_type:complete
MSLLENIPALNQRFNLTDPKLIDFHPTLLSMMDIRKEDQVFFNHIEHFDQVISGYSHLGHSYVAVHHGRPLAVFGVIPLWGGVAEAWLITDSKLGSIARPFHRVTKLMFDLFMSELCLFRLQVTVHTGNVRAIKWIKTLYFQEEGRLRKYGPDKEDFFMFSRIK